MAGALLGKGKPALIRATRINGSNMSLAEICVELFAVVLIFLATCFRNASINHWIPTESVTEWHQRMPLLREWLFYGAFCLLAFIARRNLNRILTLWNAASWRSSAFVILALLALSFQALPASLGDDYQQMSLQPFADHPDGVYRRVLSPALAHLLHLSGILYPLYCLLFTWATIALLLSTLQRMSGRPLLFIEKLAICTCAFVIYEFQFPGYPDIGIVALTVMLWQGRLDKHGELLIIAMLLACHEALALVSLISLLPILKRPKLVCLVIALYFIAWLANFGFDPKAALAAQSISASISPWILVRNHPGLTLLGVLFAYKLMLWPIGSNLLRMVRQRDWRACWTSGGNMLLAFSQIVIATDISRLAGMACIAIVDSYAAFIRGQSLRIRRTFAIAQIALPSTYVGLMAVGAPKVMVFAGAYGYIISLLPGSWHY
jgi:hypothetical protein